MSLIQLLWINLAANEQEQARIRDGGHLHSVRSGRSRALPLSGHAVCVRAHVYSYQTGNAPQKDDDAS